MACEANLASESWDPRFITFPGFFVQRAFAMAYAEGVPDHTWVEVTPSELPLAVASFRQAVRRQPVGTMATFVLPLVWGTPSHQYLMRHGDEVARWAPGCGGVRCGGGAGGS